MLVDDPFSYVVNSLISIIYSKVRDICVDIQPNNLVVLVEEPSKKEFGDLSIPLHRLSRICNVSVDDLSETLRNLSLNDVFSKVEMVKGYLNVFINEVNYARVLANTVRMKGQDYGFLKDDKRLNVVVEFVSANPVHPLHIGSGRNAVLGEFLSRIFEVRGHRVQRRYYVNDLGRQVATLVYGYLKLGRPKVPQGLRPDEWFGFIYAVTNTVVDVIKIRNEIKGLSSVSEELVSKRRELDELMSTLAELRSKDEALVDKLLNEISKDEDPDKVIEDLMRRYEIGDEEVVDVFRYVVREVLSGIDTTLRRLGIRFDVWDLESDLVFSGLVRDVLDLARRSKYFTLYKGVPALDFKELQSDDLIRQALKLPKATEIPPLILMRSDGTTLYVTRDIAYTIHKFKDFNADLVINVIGNEQTLAQAQLRLALYALGFRDEASKLLHYSYELVTLPGIKMSGRRGRYVSVDQVLDHLGLRVEEIMKTRGINVDNHVKEVMAVGAFKYMMLSSSPTKVINFNYEAALDLNRNSAPYLQYTYARTCGVLRKYGRGIEWDSIDYTSANDPIRRELLLQLSKFAYIMSKTFKDLDPEVLVTYLNRLADIFNAWYDSQPILHEVNEGVKQFKLFLTYVTNIVIKNGLYVMGIDVLERI